MKKTLSHRCLKAACFVILLLSGCKKDDLLLPAVQQDTDAGMSSSTETGTGFKEYIFDETSLKGWTKVFEDEFSTGLEKWSIWTGGAYNYELQHYQQSNLVLSGGVLNIEARKETVTGKVTPYETATKQFEFTSGRIESKTHFSAGTATPKVRMMARIKIPSGYGMWPAFWSYGDPWPTQGEIDILEARGHEPFQYSTAYWYGRRSGVNQTSGTEKVIQSPASLVDYWHVYEVIWEKNSLTFLFDGKIVDTKTGGNIPNFFRKSQRVTLNLAVGGLFFGNPPPPASAITETGTMQVDWVKVFTSK